MTNSFIARALVLTVFGLSLFAVEAAAGGGAARWGDFALSGIFGSAEVSFQKRLFEPSVEEDECARCKHYVEVRLGIDEDDLDGEEVDIEHLTAAYRYYFYVNAAERWAAFLAAGLSRYDLDPGETQSGWNLRAGAEISVTGSCKKEGPKGDRKNTGELKRSYWSWEFDATHHRVETPGSRDFEFWSYQTGPRITFSSKRDRARVAGNDNLCPTPTTIQ